MIQFSNVGKKFGEAILFSEATFTLGRKERWGVVGRNGSGKTTLFRLITGKETPDEGQIAIPKNYRIGTLEQHICFQKKSVLEEAILLLPAEDGSLEYRAKRILAGLGFSADQLASDPAMLSGGYQLRLQLAKVLLAEPDCLLLDEPTNYLDIVSIRWLESFLRDWPGEMMVISHDKSFLDRIATHILGLYRKQLRKFAGTTDHFFGQIVQEEEIYERTRQKNEKKRAHLQGFIDRFGAKATKAAQAQSRQKAMDKISVLEKLTEQEQLCFQFKEAPFPSQRMLEVEHLTFSYAADIPPIITDFSLHIAKSSRLAIIGKNGRGKSTLLSLLAGLLTPQHGQWWKSENLRMGYFGQTHIDRLNPHSTIEEEISAANPALQIGEVRSLCGLMLFSGDAAKKKISLLSGGERSRVLLGKILATPCNLLLLDEPTHHLDMESVEALLLAVKHFAGAVVLVTHDESLLQQFGQQLIVCLNNKMELFEGDYSLFLEKGGWEREENSEPVVQTKAPPESRRQERAERAEQRAKIKACENAIIATEQKLKKEESLLQEAIEKGDGIAISKHSHEMTTHQKAIEELFEELEDLSNQ